MRKKLPVSEMFNSFSGEAPTIGRYTTFIRFGVCNMKELVGMWCPFCDTPYSLNKQNETKTIEDIIKFINEANTNLVVFTGGEPSLFIDEIYKIIRINCNDSRESRNFKDYQIETNGSIKFDLNYFDYVVISPKFFHNVISPNQKRKDYPIETLEDIKDGISYLNITVKFVYEDKSSKEFILNTVEKYSLDKRQVWIMPEGTSHLELIGKSKEVFSFCRKYGFNFGDRMQITYFGNKRGF